LDTSSVKNPGATGVSGLLRGDPGRPCRGLSVLGLCPSEKLQIAEKFKILWAYYRCQQSRRRVYFEHMSGWR